MNLTIFSLNLGEPLTMTEEGHPPDGGRPGEGLVGPGLGATPMELTPQKEGRKPGGMDKKTSNSPALKKPKNSDDTEPGGSGLPPTPAVMTGQERQSRTHRRRTFGSGRGQSPDPDTNSGRTSSTHSMKTVLEESTIPPDEERMETEPATAPTGPMDLDKINQLAEEQTHKYLTEAFDYAAAQQKVQSVVSA